MDRVRPAMLIAARVVDVGSRGESGRSNAPRAHPTRKFLSWLRTVAPNIHPNVDGEVAYAAPINGLAVGYIQV